MMILTTMRMTKMTSSLSYEKTVKLLTGVGARLASLFLSISVSLLNVHIRLFDRPEMNHDIIYSNVQANQHANNL